MSRNRMKARRRNMNVCIKLPLQAAKFYLKRNTICEGPILVISSNTPSDAPLSIENSTIIKK